MTAGPVEPLPAPALTLVEGSCFLVGSTDGRLLPDRAHGLFVRDTRVLSSWRLEVDGFPLEPLSVRTPAPYAARFISRARPVGAQADSSLVMVQDRYIGDGLREDITLQNTAAAALRCVVTLTVDADFADLFSVKDGRGSDSAPGGTVSLDGGGLRITRARGLHAEEVLVRASGAAHVTARRLSWQAVLPGHGRWAVTVEVVPGYGGHPLVLRHPAGTPLELALPAARLRQWRHRAPRLHTADPGLASTLARSVEDLGALRIFDPDHPDRAVVAAGAPWYMALFGRDSLITSWMVLHLDASLALGTVQTLAAHQGRAEDATSEEQPGRILHELRFGTSTAFALGDRRAYYGSADATPLFVMVLAELARWGHAGPELDALVAAADAALAWITTEADPDADGFVEYARRTATGLRNQGWKDSDDGVSFADGRLPEAPIALCEVQAYCYGAFVARAELAERSGDPATAAAWTQRAATLKRAFNERFWLADRGYFALGLDRDKQPIDALTSNLGHCLWTGIVDDEHAAAVAAHLLSPAMFSGWGVRTLASTMQRYNPMSYHNGSIWPHDNAVCVAGLIRYGLLEEARRVAEAVLDAAVLFGHRLPELYCGFDRGEFDPPVPYPAACSPQAWASAAPLFLLRSLLQLRPDPDASDLSCAPLLPERYLPLRLSGVPVGARDFVVEVGPDQRATVRRAEDDPA